MDRLNAYRITLLGVLSVIVLGALAIILTLPAEPSQEQYRAGLLSAIAVPTIAALLNLLRTDTVNSKVDSVKEQVDGHMESHSQLLESALQTVKEVKLQQSGLGATAPPRPPDPNVPPPGI